MPTTENMMNCLRCKLPLLLTALLLSACAGVVDRRDGQTLYDLGVPGSIATLSKLDAVVSANQPERVASGVVSRIRPLTLVVGEISAPAWMDSNRMLYRLAYENPLEARAYANARWTMPPSRLFLQRLKSRLSEAGGVVLGSGDVAQTVPQLRLEAEDFSHAFQSPASSTARVVVRATVLESRQLVAQKTFVGSALAATPDAAGGVQALAVASDAVIADMISWLSTLPASR